jgi:hypothetical protein
MYGLGLRLTLRSGREPLVRLLVTAAAVAVGVVIMLAVLADFHAFTATNDRPAWESTQGQPAVTAAPAAHAELWNFSDDIYQGQTIERLDVAALGPGAPVPPGVSRLPAAGEYFASPALAALIRRVPPGELGDRFPGRLAGTIGHQALTGPGELVVFVGYPPAKLAGLPATTLVRSIAVHPGRQLWTSYFRDAFAVGAAAFLFPILVLVGTATRLAAARREERYAALRLAGATAGQIGVISAVEAVVSSLLGSLAGAGIFVLLRPALAGTAITSARYFPALVTPTARGYLAVLVAVPAASALAAQLSLHRVRISPLGVRSRVTPPPPSAWQLAPLLAGLALLVTGLLLTSHQAIGGPVYPGLIVTMAGLVAAGPWLTSRAARLLSRAPGAAPLLAARRLADDPRAAFRSVTGLVLAVFLGTLVAGMLPAVESVTTTPAAVRDVLLDGFTASPVCGDSVNCTTVGGRPGLTAPQRRAGLLGLPPAAGGALLRGLRAVAGTEVIPLYSGPGGAVVSCAGLRELAVLGRCAPHLAAVVVPAQNLFDDNPVYSTRPIAGPASPAARLAGGRYLQAVLVKVNSAATLERARTYLDTRATLSASGTAPRTFGEEAQARGDIAATIQRLLYIAVALTLVVAGCSLAVTVCASLVERKRPFTLLRVAGTPAGALYRVVLLEAVLPLLAATVAAAGVAYAVCVLTVSKIAPAGTAVPVPGRAYFALMAAGLAASLLAILASLPLLGRLTGPGGVRFE